MATRALIVEDDKDLADVIAEVLQRREIESAQLHSGATAHAYVREHKPDVVLLDLMLPDRDGYAVCQEIKLDRHTHLTPIVMVTALSQHQDVVKGLAVGANEYIVKPFDIDGLYAAIDRAIAWRKSLLDAGAHGEIQIHLQSDTRLLEDLNTMLSQLLLYTPLSADDVFNLTLAVREMCGNAMEWGHGNQRELLVTVTYRIERDRVVITIKDTGPGFVRDNLPHAANPKDPAAHIEVRKAMGLRIGGFGILMTRGLVDEMNYNDTGNEVQLVKYFTPRAA